jgi:hypothetical protein
MLSVGLLPNSKYLLVKRQESAESNERMSLRFLVCKGRSLLVKKSMHLKILQKPTTSKKKSMQISNLRLYLVHQQLKYLMTLLLKY